MLVNDRQRGPVGLAALAARLRKRENNGADDIASLGISGQLAQMLRVSVAKSNRRNSSKSPQNQARGEPSVKEAPHRAASLGSAEFPVRTESGQCSPLFQFPGQESEAPVYSL
jgi:hypothetical protein